MKIELTMQHEEIVGNWHGMAMIDGHEFAVTGGYPYDIFRKIQDEVWAVQAAQKKGEK